MTQAYTHPCIPTTLQELDTIKANLDKEPWKRGYEILAADGHSSLNYVMQCPFAEVSRAPYLNLNQWRNDMVAVYNLARMWYFTGNNAYAQKARDILIAWANTHTYFGAWEAALELGDYAVYYGGGASILRGTWSGWTAADTTAVKNYFLNTFWPASLAGVNVQGPANKGALYMAGGMAIAVFCDDTAKFNYLVDQFRAFHGTGLMNTLAIGEMGETGRDLGHGHATLSGLTFFAECAWKQGVDLYSEMDNRLLACGEYYCRNTFTTATLALASFPAVSLASSGLTLTTLGSQTAGRSASYANGVWTVTGLGNSVWNDTTDDCRFVYRQMTGNCAIIAKVTSATYSGNSNGKAGMMIRDTLANTFSQRAWVGVVPAATKLIESHMRGWTENWGSTGYDDRLHTWSPGIPYWIKIERRGKQITTFASPDGTSWSALNCTYYGNLPSTLYIGLFISSGTTVAQTATFANVAFTGGTGGLVTTPAAPALIATVAPTDNFAVTVRWLPSFGATSYDLLRSTSINNGYTVLAGNLTGTSYVDSAVSAGTNYYYYYYYKARTKNSAGTSGDSSLFGGSHSLLITPMAYLAVGGTATDDLNSAPTTNAAGAFDRNPGSLWFHGGGTTGWLQYDFGAGNAQVVKRYTVNSAYFLPERDPKNWTFQGSNNGTNWTTLNSQSNQSFANRYQMNTYNIGNTTAYRYYRLNVTANNGEVGLQLSELGLWGDIPNDLVAWYELEGNFNDSSGNGNNGTAAGSPAYTAGYIGQAIDLDGSNDIVTLPASVTDSDDMTVAAWVNWDGGGNWQRIFDFGTGTWQYLFLTPSSGDGTLRFAIKNTAGEQIVETTQLSTGVWVHVAVTLQGNTTRLYVNGVLRSTNTGVTINPSDFKPWANYIGKSQWGADPLFNGRIDDFRVYSYALSAEGVAALAAQSPEMTPPAAPTGLNATAGDRTVHLDWADNSESDFDDYTVYRSTTSGGGYSAIASGLTTSSHTDNTVSNGMTYYYVVTAVDMSGGESADSSEVSAAPRGTPIAHYELEGNTLDGSGNGNHATATGSPAYAAGRFGQTIDLDGSNDYVRIPSGVVSDVENLTVTAWVNWDGGGNWQRVFDFGDSTSRYLFLTPSSGGGTLRFAFNNGNGEQVAEATTALATGTWVHLAVTLNGDTSTLYVNGSPVATKVAAINPLGFDLHPVNNYIGKSQFAADPLFNGRIDDFRIYDYAISAAQAAALASNTAPPSFTVKPIDNLFAIEDAEYAGNSLAVYTQDPDGLETVTFSKDAGPNWLSVALDGTLSGIPGDPDVGENTFIVRVTDGGGLYDTAQMNIQVLNTYSGTQGLNDLLGLASRWLMQDCTDIPACGGADLDGDYDVDLSDLAKLASNWQTGL